MAWLKFPANNGIIGFLLTSVGFMLNVLMKTLCDTCGFLVRGFVSCDFMLFWNINHVVLALLCFFTWLYYFSNVIMNSYVWSHLLELRREFHYLNIFPLWSCKDHELTLGNSCVRLLRCGIWMQYLIELPLCELGWKIGNFQVLSVKITFWDKTYRWALLRPLLGATGGHRSSLIFV